MHNEFLTQFGICFCASLYAVMQQHPFVINVEYSGVRIFVITVPVQYGCGIHTLRYQVFNLVSISHQLRIGAGFSVVRI
jgi:hypothetical protein